MSVVEWTDEEREAVTYRLVHHYRVGLSNGECLCGHKVPLGHSFTAHQADEALNALSDLVAAREAQAAAKALREVGDARYPCPVHGIPDCSPLLNGCSIPARHVPRLHVLAVADRIERGESS